RDYKVTGVQTCALPIYSAAADYIALYKGDKKTLAESLSAIQETSSRILDELLPEQRLTPAHEKQTERALADKPAQSQEEPGRPDLTEEQPAGQMPDQSDSISMDR